jgi:hypothetical protein
MFVFINELLAMEFQLRSVILKVKVFFFWNQSCGTFSDVVVQRNGNVLIRIIYEVEWYVYDQPLCQCQMPSFSAPMVVTIVTTIGAKKEKFYTCCVIALFKIVTLTRTVYSPNIY